MNKINLVIITCFLTFFLSWYWQSDLIVEYFAFSGNNLLNIKFWTPVTALFLHGDLLHLLGNMLFLFVFGNTLENEVEAKKTLSIFFIGGILSFLLSLFFYSLDTYMIGASAAIFTLTAVVMLIKPLKFSFLFLMPQGLVAIIYFVYNVILAYINHQSNVAFISHVIGFLIGIPAGIAWSEDWAKNLLITIGLFLLFLFLTIFLIPNIMAFLQANG
ncbi:MAG: rhomboid family intramembrane serine protease [Candidatus Bathyarchaeota archaeon]